MALPIPSALDQVQLQQQVVAQVSASPELRAGDVLGLSRLITEQVARQLDVERVSVWLFNDAKDELHCQDLYRLSADQHEDGAVLHEHAFAAEFSALRAAKVVDAHDPYTDPRTRGYVDVYLKPNRISSMLDAVVRLGEELIGLFCLEQVDRPHRWSDAEIAFASQLGDQIALVISIARTHQVAAQLRERDAELQRFNEQLEQRVQERSAALQSAQAALASAQNLASLGKVLAGVAHELNTPIGNGLLVAGTLHAQAQNFAATQRRGQLSRRALDDFIEQQVQGAQMVERSLQRAVALVQSLKTVATDQVSGERRRFKLQAVVQDVMEMLEPGLRRTSCRIDLQVTVDPLLELDSYPGPLGQVLVNLVNNAVLHAFEGREQGRLIITAQALDSGWLRMEVADDGCGIATERLHRLFDAFYSSKFGQGSCGLGLHLVQDIVTQRLGGRIAVSSSPGQGCSFRFELPLQAPA
jgi:signal transduction histidine kinase